MRILVTGATGFIGAALLPFLTTGGHQVARLVRARPDPGDVLWDPAAGTVDLPALEGFDAVIHLAGENIAQPWSTAAKQRILESRSRGTRVLSEALAQMQRPPRVLVSASGVGYYGDRGDEVLREESRPGSDFLAEVCQAWEGGTAPASAAGIRVVNLRFGVILSPEGGALPRMLPPFRLGVGGPIGSGRQWMSWIALDDVLGVLLHALATESLAGPANAAAPNPVTNAEFARTLGRVMGRPALFRVPALAIRAVFGAMGQGTILASQRAVPARLLETGYAFRYPALEGALRHVLGKEE